jgi:hypothetical protein
MFPVTLRTEPEAKLPKAARPSWCRSLGHETGRMTCSAGAPKASDRAILENVAIYRRNQGAPS